MSGTNAFVSNGTCYTAKGEKLDGSFIPCGNDAFGHQTCCGAGDNCLADNACFGIHGTGYGSYLTYYAGCTDENYEDATCPKKDIDQPWVALTLCDDSNGEWALCSQAGNPSTLQPGSYCSCTNAASATVAFSDSNTLTSICSLPASTGQSIQFFVGHFPSSVPAPASTSAAPSPNSASSSPTSAGATGGSTAASSAGSPTSGSTSGPTSSTIPTSSGASSVTVFTSGGTTFTSSTVPLTTSSTTAAGGSSGGSSAHSGLSSGATIGIGVGAGIGALVILLSIILLAFFLIRRHRRQRPSRRSKVESGDYDDNESVPSRFSKTHGLKDDSQPPMSAMSTTAPPVYNADGQTVPEADGRAAAWPWALRNELEGSRPTRYYAGPPAELPGDERFAGEQRAPNTLAQEANRQIGPGWNGPSLKRLNGASGKQQTDASSIYSQ